MAGATAALTGCAGGPSAGPGGVVTTIRAAATGQPPEQHQPGVTTPPPDSAAPVAFDFMMAGSAQLASLLQVLTRRVAAVTADAAERPGRLTVTVAVGASLPGDRELMDRLVWVRAGGGEPAWTAGATYQVVRLIRLATELWSAEPVEHQEDVFGRHKRTGAPLARNREDQEPNFAVDPSGRITPLDAHIRRANPRTGGTEASRILRRSYSYRRGHDAAGQSDEGLIFVCFQQDLERGFATVQRRLRGEALEKYVLPFGGGYFFVLPGVPPSGFLGQQLLEAAR